MHLFRELWSLSKSWQKKIEINWIVASVQMAFLNLAKWCMKHDNYYARTICSAFNVEAQSCGSSSFRQ